MSLKKLRESSFRLPLVFLTLHLITYSSFFYLMGRQHHELWMRGVTFILWIVMLPTIYLPNFAGWFLIFSSIRKESTRKTIAVYVSALMVEHLQMVIDVMGEFDGGSPKAKYFIMFSRLDFIDGNSRHILNVSIICAVVHLVVGRYALGRGDNAIVGRGL